MQLKGNKKRAESLLRQTQKEFNPETMQQVGDLSVQGRAVRPTHAPQIKKELPQLVWGSFFMPVVGVEPTRVISTRDFEFWGEFSIWCHLVPDFKAKKQQYIE